MANKILNNFKLLKNTFLKNKYSSYIYEAECLICKSKFVKPRSYFQRNKTGCINCKIPYQTKKKEEFNFKFLCLNKDLTVIKKIYSTYKRRNKITIDLKTFRFLIKQNCFYCNKSPSNNIKGFKYNGLDRLNSNKFYSLNNVVTCCIECNTMKRDKTLKEFFNKIKCIYKNVKKQIK